MILVPVGMTKICFAIHWSGGKCSSLKKVPTFLKVTRFKIPRVATKDWVVVSFWRIKRSRNSKAWEKYKASRSKKALLSKAGEITAVKYPCHNLPRPQSPLYFVAEKNKVHGAWWVYGESFSGSQQAHNSTRTALRQRRDTWGRDSVKANTSSIYTFPKWGKFQ